MITMHLSRKKRRCILLSCLALMIILTASRLMRNEPQDDSDIDFNLHPNVYKREVRQAQIQMPDIVNHDDLTDVAGFTKQREEHVMAPLARDVIELRHEPRKGNYLNQFTDSNMDYMRETNPPVLLQLKVVMGPKKEDDIKDVDFSDINIKDYINLPTEGPVVNLRNPPPNVMPGHPEKKKTSEVEAQKLVETQNDMAAIQLILGELEKKDPKPGKEVVKHDKLTTRPDKKTLTPPAVYEYEIYTTPRFLYEYSSTIEIVIPNPNLVYDEYPLPF